MLMTRKEVEAEVGLSRASIYRLMGLSRFPRPLVVGSKAVRWPRESIDAWLSSRPHGGGSEKSPEAV